MNIWLVEIWHAWRAMLRRPGFLLLASGVLALGIGASVAVATLIDQVLMQPLPLPDASRVMVVGPVFDGQRVVSPLQYQHLMPLEHIESTGATLFSKPNVNITGGSRPTVVSAAYIDRGMLPTLGLHPLLGRNFTAQEDAPNGPHAVMLGYGFWQRRYGGNPEVLGQALDVEGVGYTVVGILPKSFDSLAFSGDVALPLALPPHSTVDGLNDIALVRLDSGAHRQAMAAEMDAHLHAMYAALGSKYVENWKEARFGAQPIAAWQHANAHATLMLFMACALFVLLTALVNLVNLMLLRSLSQAHDSAVRDALGASRSRLVLPALAEGLLVGIVGALVGTTLAWTGLHALQGAVSADWLPGAGIRMPVWMGLAATVAAAAVAVSAAAFGVWRSQATVAGETLREGGRSGLDRRSGRLGRALVVAQMFLATVLLCGSGLLLHGLYKASQTPLGFSSANMLAFDLAPVRADYPDAQSVNALSERLVRGLEAIPGVTTATVTTNLPTGPGHAFNTNVRSHGSERVDMDYFGVGPEYFGLFDIAVLRGRAFTRDDVRGGEQVAIVNRALALRMYGGHALGERIQEDDGRSARIVGVVADTRQSGPLQPAPGIVYVPLAQIPDGDLDFIRYFMPMRVVLRGHGDPGQWGAAARAAVAQIAPGQPVSGFSSMDEIVRSTTADTHRTLLLVGVFATLALLLAMAGMYAVMAVAVAAREREFGVRTALGAVPARLMWQVLRNGMAQIAVGLMVGIAIVLGISRLLGQLLLSLAGRGNTFDPVALGGACAVLAIAGLFACLLPALRASRVAPMRALRGE
ncbi:ABC transporter permease [Rhodanobacter sp. DHG33]|uniref:ABC transporter permease n=1 Tax=Rhodanobacter sp. DHG33 TaxID=2775921 RepID=UPI0017800FF3|nr:ABC transporter permease [Rhodanobacter sp. DHG33]MBD8897562.1 ABC transporter permease [Rhodanobacter sp. DHG33]